MAPGMCDLVQFYTTPDFYPINYFLMSSCAKSDAMIKITRLELAIKATATGSSSVFSVLDFFLLFHLSTYCNKTGWEKRRVLEKKTKVRIMRRM